jgi:hypothetical protein
MKKNFLLTALAVVSTTCFSQKSEIRNIETFDKITAFGSIEIFLEKGNKESIRLESESVDLSEVKVKMDGKTLKLSTAEMLFSSRREVKVTLTYRELRGITLRAGASLYDTSVISGDKLEIIAGSGASLNLKLQVNALQISVGQGANAGLAGKCTTQEVDVTTGGLYDAYYLKCDNTYVNANTGGTAKVSATLTLDASASTGGGISYRGNPVIKNNKSSLGGSVEKVTE